MARAGARAGPFFSVSLRIGRSIAGSKGKNGEKKPPLPSGYGGRSEHSVPQLGGPHPSSIRLGSPRPNTTTDATTLPEPEAGVERSRAEDPGPQTMSGRNVKGIVRRVKHNVSGRHKPRRGNPPQKPTISSCSKPAHPA